MAIVLIIAIEIAIICSRTVSRSAPLNVILLGIFVVCEAYLVAYICHDYDPMLVAAALLITVAGFIGMTLYAFLTKNDLTIWYAWLFGISLAFLAFGLVFLFVYNKILYLIFCLIGVILGLIYVAFDT